MYIKNENKFIGWLGIFIGLLLFGLILILKSILWPFLLSIGLAYIIDPLVNKLQKKIYKREIAIVIAILIYFLLVSIFFVAVIPILIHQIINIFEIFPDMLNLFNIHIISWLNHTFNLDLDLINLKTITSLIMNHTNEVKFTLSKIVLIIEKRSGGAINLLISLILMPFLLYYFLLDWEKWKNNFYILIPRRFYTHFVRIVKDIDKVLGAFIKGQLNVMFLMGIIFGLSLTFIGLKNGFLIGVISGFLVFIPYLGAITGLFLSVLTAVSQFNSFYNILLVIIVFLVCHFLESFVITPKLVGEKIGLSPLLVIFSLFAFGKLMGFAGILLSLPLASICSVLFKEGLKWYLSSNFYLNK